ncbi:MAG TPA: thioredoxin fold domain-containing protein [Candidatus Dormibacteraeota bacterium]|nr:thioredoxin fold domain-containing protein [Candidatus Dormibacteraeota bacterium]
MKRVLFFIVLVSGVSLVGCNGDELTIDMSKIVTDTNAPPVNLAVEVTRAKTENKLLLLEFGSSDSCPPCIVFEQKVFSTPEFKAYEKSNLDFVRLDFPLKVNLRPDTTATNALLSQQFEADGFPTFVALDKNGKEFWRMPQKGDLTLDTGLFQPTNFIALIESVKKKEK